MDRRIRILFLSWRDHNHPEAGGAEKYLTEVAEGLAQRGHQVTIRTAAYPGALPDEVVHGVHYARRGGHYSVYPRSMLSQLVGRQRADVVVDIQNGVPFCSSVVSRTPVVNVVHHVHKEQWPVVFDERLARVGWLLESAVAPRVYRDCDYVAVSDATRNELIGLGVDGDRVTVIHNGTDVVADPEIRRSPTPLVTVLGRLVPHKRVEIALEAMARLGPTHPDLRMQVVGSGWWSPTLERLATELGVTDRVEFTGQVSDVEKHRLLAESWVLALPSIKEGWGLVVVEAGVHGTPTVAFHAAGGLRDSVRHDETGLLVPDGVAEFTRGLQRVIDDEALRARLSANVVDWVSRFRWSDTVDAWERTILRAAERA